MVELTMQNLSETRQHIAQELSKTKATEKEIARAKLLLEETFMRLKTGMGNLPDFSVKVTLKVRFGDVNLRLSARGEEYNPIVTVTEQSTDDEDAYRLIILKSFRDKMNFVRKNGENIVTITVHEKSSAQKQMIYTIAALVLGIVCGFAMQFGLDAETINFINTEIINPVRRVFLNALFMLAPVTLLSLGFAFLVFSGDLSYLQSAIQTGGEQTASQYGSLKDMIFDIVPNNLVDPLKGKKILQVLFLAIFFGVVLNRMGEKARGATETLDFLFKFTVGVLKIIVKAIPLIVFISMSALLATTGIDSLLTLTFRRAFYRGNFRLDCQRACDAFNRKNFADSSRQKTYRLRADAVHNFKFECALAVRFAILHGKIGRRSETCFVFNPRRYTAQQDGARRIFFARHGDDDERLPNRIDDKPVDNAVLFAGDYVNGETVNSLRRNNLLELPVFDGRCAARSRRDDFVH
ncbi:MAG: dicarboxylate/amino acid:cation symporter [Selenomonadaceae bacterium]|nr:dicarboxylate/amino acid:cation symporter [Selenomonadaceae bacterium]